MARAAADSRKATAVADQPLAPAVSATSLEQRAGTDDRAGRGQGQVDGTTGERCKLYTREVTEPAGRLLELATWLVKKSRTGMAAPARSGRGQRAWAVNRRGMTFGEETESTAGCVLLAASRALQRSRQLREGR